MTRLIAILSLLMVVACSDENSANDETPVTGTAVLKLGQTIKVGTPGEKLQLIACVETNET